MQHMQVASGNVYMQPNLCSPLTNMNHARIQADQSEGKLSGKQVEQRLFAAHCCRIIAIQSCSLSQPQTSGMRHLMLIPLMQQAQRLPDFAPLPATFPFTPFACTDALALAGVDYLVVNERIVDALDKATTLQGYNDGYRADEDDDDSVPQQLSAETAQETDFSESETTEVTRQLFEEGLGMAGLELLDSGIKSLVQDVERLEPAFHNLAIDSL